ncbi:MAG: recombinase family protein [Clostridia bacterium]|nr:recombinase family protein [Clostridia bacterium]
MAKIVAVAYARYSSDRQQESSITVQLNAIRKFCQENNIKLIHEYVDEAQSGTNARRKHFQQMIEDAKERKFRLVIVHRMDRWARNVDDARHYKKLLLSYGVKMASAIEGFNESPEGEFFELMSMGMAELYSKKLSREAVAGKLANARECRIHGGVPLLGFKVKGKYYVIDDNDARIAQIIFDMVAKRYSYRQIREFLISNGYRRSNGDDFRRFHFTDMLRNRKYIGEYVYNRSRSADVLGRRNNHSNKSEDEIIRIPNGLPRIIDDETFFKVQEILDNRQKYKNYQPENPDKKYVLSGLTKCAVCGRAMSGRKSNARNGFTRVYACNEKGCVTKAINIKYIEEYLHSLFCDCLFDEDNIDSFCELVRIAYVNAFEKLIDDRDNTRFAIRNLDESELKSRIEQGDKLYEYMDENQSDYSIERAQLIKNLRELEEKLNAFPQLDYRVIRQERSRYLTMLRERDEQRHKLAYSRMIEIIKIDNDRVQITLKLQTFLNFYLPIQITIIEDRDNIALPKFHHQQALEFSQMRVRL